MGEERMKESWKERKKVCMNKKRNTVKNTVGRP